jgi:hypothetical protein
MARPLVSVFDDVARKQIDREMNDVELAAYTVGQIAQAAANTAETARLALVESGDAKLRTAGLTQPEIDARRTGRSSHVI